MILTQVLTKDGETQTTVVYKDLDNRMVGGEPSVAVQRLCINKNIMKGPYPEKIRVEVSALIEVI